jgi:hypothetical protein
MTSLTDTVLKSISKCPDCLGNCDLILESLRQALDEPKLTGTHAEIAQAIDENLDIYEVLI